MYDLLRKQIKNEIATRPDSVDVIYGYSYSVETGIIAALSVDPSIKIYDCNTNNLLFELQGPDLGKKIPSNAQLIIFDFFLDRVCSLSLSRDGKRLITGFQDGSMRIYSLKY